MFMMKTSFSHKKLSSSINVWNIKINYQSDWARSVWKVLSQLTTCRHPPPPLKSGKIGFLVQKVSQCSETNEKSIFRFLVFEILSFKILRIVWQVFFCPRRCDMFWSWFKTNFDSFVIISFWDMIDFVLNILSELGTYTRIWFRKATQW